MSGFEFSRTTLGDDRLELLRLLRRALDRAGVLALELERELSDVATVEAWRIRELEAARSRCSELEREVARLRGIVGDDS